MTAEQLTWLDPKAAAELLARVDPAGAEYSSAQVEMPLRLVKLKARRALFERGQDSWKID